MKKGRILVVDDNRGIRSACCSFIQNAGESYISYVKILEEPIDSLIFARYVIRSKTFHK